MLGAKWGRSKAWTFTSPSQGHNQRPRPFTLTWVTNERNTRCSWTGVNLNLTGPENWKGLWYLLHAGLSQVKLSFSFLCCCRPRLLGVIPDQKYKGFFLFSALLFCCVWVNFLSLCHWSFLPDVFHQCLHQSHFVSSVSLLSYGPSTSSDSGPTLSV